MPIRSRVWTFVRHGQSRANAEGWLAGQHDSPLTERGSAQAVAARPRIADVPIGRAFASDLQRARRTAEIVLEERGVPLIVTEALRERGLGSWTGRTVNELEADGGMDLLARWTGRPPDGESLRDVAVRATTWLASVDDADVDTLVVAHGALIRAVLGRLDGMSTDRIGSWRPGNCEVLRRELEPGAWARLLEDL